MTYNVFGGTLNLNQSTNQSTVKCYAYADVSILPHCLPLLLALSTLTLNRLSHVIKDTFDAISELAACRRQMAGVCRVETIYGTPDAVWTVSK